MQGTKRVMDALSTQDDNMIRIKRAGVSVHVSIDSNLIALSSENCFYVDVSSH